MASSDKADAVGAAAGFLAWHGMEKFELKIWDAVQKPTRGPIDVPAEALAHG
jgi:hypothetical protein